MRHICPFSVDSNSCINAFHCHMQQWSLLLNDSFQWPIEKTWSVRFLTDINVSVNGGFLQSVGVLWHFAAKNNCPLDLFLEYVDCRGQFLQEIEGPMCGALWRSMWHGTESIQGPMWQPRPDITTAAF